MTSSPILVCEPTSTVVSWACSDLDETYRRCAIVGSGTFGEVFRAIDKRDDKVVALKRVKTEGEKEGFPITALREIRLLQQLHSQLTTTGVSDSADDQKVGAANVVRLLEVCSSRCTDNALLSNFFLVFEYCEHDLVGIINNVKLTPGEIKNILKQLFEALFFVHSNGVLHRDIKASNILVNKNGTVKLADFGLSRSAVQSDRLKQTFTNRVVTLWYRPPELLLGDRQYGSAVDMWGTGCVMAEMWTKRPIFQGATEQEQINHIIKLCGSLTPAVWPKIVELPLYKVMELPTALKNKVKERFSGLLRDKAAVDLLVCLLTLDPSRRITATNALDHAYFWEGCEPADLKNTLSKYELPMNELSVSNQAHHRRAQRQFSQHTAKAGPRRPSNEIVTSTVNQVHRGANHFPDEYRDRVF